MKRIILLSMLACSCGKFSNFTLPSPDPQGPSGPFHWEASPDPVITRGNASDVLNPSVIFFHGQFLNYYSVYEKTWSTALASSSDGIHWTQLGNIITPDAGNGSAIAAGDKVMYWYQTQNPVKIALWKHDGIVLDTGPRGSWDEAGVADPYVIQRLGVFYMYYLGMDRARRQRLGLARSRDGVVWEKLVSNPIMDLGGSGAFDEMGLGEPAVWTSGGSYWMLYTGRARGEKRRIGLAKSSDGVEWEKQSMVIEGTSDWNREVICDPTVEVVPEGIRVWFGGGDVARPDQGLHGQIGVGWLKSLP